MPDFDLAQFVAAVRAYAPIWERAGITWRLTLGPVRDKSAAWIDCEIGDVADRLIIWTSGEAELDVGDTATGVASTHYDLSSSAELGGCLAALTQSLAAAAERSGVAATE
ncbi:MAG TPA: hypothetical protein VGN81_08690 [Pseudonocardiaceae bacterium]